jgi:hypothetical protein
LLDGSFAVVLLHRDPGYMETGGRGGVFPDTRGAGAAAQPALARIDSRERPRHPDAAACRAHRRLPKGQCPPTRRQP